MARTTLVMFPVDAGRSLAAGIRDLLHLKAAFWLYFEEADEWRLVLATPLVESEGPKSLYGRLRRFVEQHPELKQIEVTNVSFLSPDDPIVRPIREALNGVDLGEGRLVRRSVITSESTSVYLEEAYIYFAHM